MFLPHRLRGGRVLCPVAPLTGFPGILLYRFPFLLLWLFATSWARAMHAPPSSLSCIVLVCVERLSSSKPTIFIIYKIPLLKTGYITSNYLILRKKIQSTTLTMKISYRLIDSPFKYNVSYLNDNLDYTPLSHTAITIYGTLAAAANRTTRETRQINLSVPVDDGGAGGFDYTLEVANMFDDIVLKQ